MQDDETLTTLSDKFAFGFFPESSGIMGKQLYVPFLLILTLIAVINALQECFVFFKGAVTLLNFLLFLFSNLVYCWFFLIVPLAIAWLPVKFSFSRLQLFRWLLQHLLVMSVLLLFHQFLAYYLNGFIPSTKKAPPLADLFLANPLVWLDIIGYFVFLLFHLLIENKNRYHDNEIKCSRLEVELVQTKLTELQNKLHPQFFFKSLETILSKITGNQNREAYSVLTGLSGFLRRIVYENEPEQVRLRDEISFLKKYLVLERQNFDCPVKIETSVSPGLNDALVPNNLLQMIAEELLYANTNGCITEFFVRLEADNEDLRSLHIKMYFKTNDVIDAALLNDEKQFFSIIRERLYQLYGQRQNFDASTLGEEILITIAVPFRQATLSNSPSIVTEDTI